MKAKKVYRTSSFYSLIYLYSPSSTIQTCSYSTRRNYIHEKIFLNLNDLKSFRYPNNKCPKNRKVCIFELRRPGWIPVRINITTNHLIHTYSENLQCTYAGVSTYELIKRKFQEMKKFCEANNTIKRNIHLYSSYTLLVFYSFMPNGILNVSMNFSNSKHCAIIKTNICRKKSFSYLVPNAGCAFFN